MFFCFARRAYSFGWIFLYSLRLVTRELKSALSMKVERTRSSRCTAKERTLVSSTLLDLIEKCYRIIFFLYDNMNILNDTDRIDQ